MIAEHDDDNMDEFDVKEMSPLPSSTSSSPPHPTAIQEPLIESNGASDEELSSYTSLADLIRHDIKPKGHLPFFTTNDLLGQSLSHHVTPQDHRLFLSFLCLSPSL